MKKNIRPPQWAVRFLSWYCRPELLEDLEGDLNEYFHRHVQSRGLWRARIIYVLNVFKFFRSYTIRKPEIITWFVHWLMIGSYVKTSGRNMVKSKLFSGINIFGLGISMSVGLLVIAFISDLLSYDKFHDKKDRIYRVYDSYQRSEEPAMELASTSLLAGRKIQESLPGIENAVFMRNGFGGDANTGIRILPVSGLWANESFFDVFSFPLAQGNPSLALKEPYSLVLTEKTAIRLFGIPDVLGKSIRFDSINYTVTGVMKDIPKLSHLQFELLVSYSTAEILKSDPNLLAWENIWSGYTYLLLRDDTNSDQIQKGIEKICLAENKKAENVTIRLFLQPLTEIVVGKRMGNPVGPYLPPLVIWILEGFAAVIMLSACFNYTNLSIAKSFRRSKEVGIRKVMGAQRTHVMVQFLTESMLISIFSLVLAIPLFLVLKTQFLSLAPFLQNLVSLSVTPKLILLFIALALIVGILAGLLPALYFGRVNIIQVLKNVSLIRIFKHITLRKALIVTQYTISLIFISGTLIGYDQYRGFLTFDLGFKTDNILNIRMHGNNGNLLKKSLNELPEVTDVSRSLMITSLGSMHGTTLKYTKTQDSASVWLNIVDDRYLPLHGHHLIAGRNFSVLPPSADEREIIVNEQVLKRFNIGKGDPLKALGEIVAVDHKELTIVGVLKDFHYGTTEEKIEPVILRYAADSPHGYMNVKISSSDIHATMLAVDAAWKKLDSVHPLEAVFYDDQIEEAYQQFSVMLKVIGFIGFLAICISSMGLFGMVVFTAETRVKEMSIRKVLGADNLSLMFLLSNSFLLLLMLSSGIALPATWLFFEKVVLVNFAYHSPITPWDVMLGPSLVIVLAILMIASQTLKVARANPAEVLKNE